MDCFSSRVLNKPSTLCIRGFGVWIISFLLKVLQFSFPMVTISSPTISHALLPVTSETKQLSLETELVASDNNTIQSLKPGYQTYLASFSTLCVGHWIFSMFALAVTFAFDENIGIINSYIC